MQTLLKNIKKLVNSSNKVYGALVILNNNDDDVFVVHKNFTGKQMIELSKLIKDRGLLMTKEENLMPKKEKNLMPKKEKTSKKKV